jgi:wyosine [tRNA(Phe)-imidazoG37] synthetase (radical SAM superfamily)
MSTTYKTDTPAEFYDHQESYDIMETIMNIQRNRKTMTMAEISLEHPLFKRDFPPLFAKVYRDKMTRADIKRITYMLDMRNRLKQGDVPFEEASTDISSKMAEQLAPGLLKNKK